MKNLIDFFLRHSAWAVFLLYAVLSVVMLVGGRNPYQQSVWLTSANAVSSTVYGALGYVTGYFNLHSINADLEQRNATLEMELVDLRSQLRQLRLQLPDSTFDQQALASYRLLPALVISNSIAQTHNHVTIDRGSADGLQPQMGVVDRGGVVGVVEVTSAHAARVISLLNPDISVSCKLKDSDYFGRLIWEGGDPRFATLDQLPKHTVYEVGDTVVTSGFSDMFPEGIRVGVVTGKAHEVSAGDVQLQVKLGTDFSRLSEVRVIVNSRSAELRSLNSDSLPNNDKKGQADANSSKLSRP